MKDRWKGTVVFVVQPAEERNGGAKAMLKDGLYTRFPKPDFALAFHVTSMMPVGMVTAAEGISSSSSDNVDVTVHGIGAHGAAPQMSKDPVYIASQIVVALQSITSREISPFAPAVITVGAFHSGSKHNIISDRADLQLTVRANDEDPVEVCSLRSSVSRGVSRAPTAYPRIRCPRSRSSEGTPTTVNDPVLAKRLNGVMAHALGPAAVVPFQQTTMSAEDFAYFVQPELGVPGYYFNVGGTPLATFAAARSGGAPIPSHHSPLFKIDPEPSVTTGTIAMVAAVLDLLKSGRRWRPGE